VRTIRLRCHFRYLAWYQDELLLVGDKGSVMRIQAARSINLDSGTQKNLRGISVNASDGTALIVGNSGTILKFNQKGDFVNIKSPTTENLRAVSWNPKGTEALIVGNRGVLLRYSDTSVKTIDDGRANLRRVSWRQDSKEALIASNCFADEFIPSPNLFRYSAGKETLTALNEGRVDLIGVDWNPKEQTALTVGYDIVWHTGFIGVFDGSRFLPIEFESKRVYPVTVAWEASGRRAAIGTATTQQGIGKGILYIWEQGSLRQIHSNDNVFFSCVAWESTMERLAGLASSATRTFSC
jgi:hypothetical protein